MKVLYTIPNPCPRRWEDMQGGDVKRHCASCNTMVHAINEYSTAEWARLWRESGGKVCGMLPGVSAPMPRSRRAIVVGGLLSLVSPLLAQAGRAKFLVKDASGKPIPMAVVFLQGRRGKPSRSLATNSLGEVEWPSLPLGDLRFRIEKDGLGSSELVVPIRNSDLKTIEVSLKLGIVGEIIRRR